jgi:hypothetical protein
MVAFNKFLKSPLTPSDGAREAHKMRLDYSEIYFGNHAILILELTSVFKP